MVEPVIKQLSSNAWLQVPRRSKRDIELRRDAPEEEDSSDVEEDLNHPPLLIHMYRSRFVASWCADLPTLEQEEDRVLLALMGHDPSETNCIYATGEPPSCATVDHRRTRIHVKGKPYVLPKISREGDRHIRPYHFWMYGFGSWTREELSVMSRKGEDPVGASHICGGTCVNHAQPEPNSVNQARKPHHQAMIKALEGGKINQYHKIREQCKHIPKCFINPKARKLDKRLIDTNLEEYKRALPLV